VTQHTPIRSLRAKIELVEIVVEKSRWVLDGRISTGSMLLEPNGQGKARGA
jgi:hypothetical protein